MKTLLAVMVVLFFSSQSASAWHHHHIVAKVVAPKATSGSIAGGSSGGAACTGGCLWVGGFIAAVGIAIIADEIRRGMNDPACATNKMTRKSYFGVVKDEPKLWRPLCKKTNTVSVHG